MSAPDAPLPDPVPHPVTTPDRCNDCGGATEVKPRAMGRVLLHFVRCKQCGAEQERPRYGVRSVAEWNANTIRPTPDHDPSGG